MLTLDEFFNKLDSGEIHPSTMIVRLRYKYSFETEFIEENEVLLYECDRNGAPVFVWENDWDEGQTSNGEVYVVGWIDVDDVKVPRCITEPCCQCYDHQTVKEVTLRKMPEGGCRDFDHDDYNCLGCVNPEGKSCFR